MSSVFERLHDHGHCSHPKHCALLFPQSIADRTSRKCRPVGRYYHPRPEHLHQRGHPLRTSTQCSACSFSQHRSYRKLATPFSRFTIHSKILNRELQSLCTAAFHSPQHPSPPLHPNLPPAPVLPNPSSATPPAQPSPNAQKTSPGPSAPRSNSTTSSPPSAPLGSPARLTRTIFASRGKFSSRGCCWSRRMRM